MVVLTLHAESRSMLFNTPSKMVIDSLDCNSRRGQDPLSNRTLVLKTELTRGTSQIAENSTQSILCCATEIPRGLDSTHGFGVHILLTSLSIWGPLLNIHL